MNRTRTAFELKLQKASKTTDLRIPASMCTMFNVLVDAKKQSTKLCALDGGQEVSGLNVACGNVGCPCREGWEIPWTEESGGLQSTGSQESDTTYQLNHQAMSY